MSALPLAILSAELTPLPLARKNRLLDSYAAPRNGSFTLEPNGLEAQELIRIATKREINCVFIKNWFVTEISSARELK